MDCVCLCGSRVPLPRPLCLLGVELCLPRRSGHPEEPMAGQAISHPLPSPFIWLPPPSHLLYLESWIKKKADLS